MKTHGIRSTYCAGCRCDACRAADRLYKRRWAAGRKGKLPETRQEYLARIAPTHATQRRYQKYGCRCEACRRYQARKMREFEARRRGRTLDAVCDGCGEAFTARGLRCHQHYCGAA